MLYDLEEDLNYTGSYCCEYMCDVGYYWDCPICQHLNSVDEVDEDTLELDCNECKLILVRTQHNKWHNKSISTFILDEINKYK